MTDQGSGAADRLVGGPPDKAGAAAVHATSEAAVPAANKWRGVYPGMCLDPELCRGMSSCPRDYACND